MGDFMSFLFEIQKEDKDAEKNFKKFIKKKLRKKR
jgi:hypothetical protein